MTTQDLTKLTTAELAKVYNEAARVLGAKPVKRFSDKTAALRRTQEIVAKLPKPTPGKQQRKKRGMRFAFPFHGIANLRTIQRDESLRGRVRDLLKKGAFFTDVVKEVEAFDKDRGSTPGHVERRAYEVVRLLHYYVGYGLRQDEDGKIFIHTDEPK